MNTGKLNRNEKLLNALRAALDPESWETVVEICGGETIYIPLSGCDPVKKSRNAEICSAYFSGVSVEELSERYQLSNSQVRRIINRD